MSENPPPDQPDAEGAPQSPWGPPPAGAQPPYGPPGSQPPYGQPPYGQPQHGQPQYGQPGQPSYGAPPPGYGPPPGYAQPYGQPYGYGYAGPRRTEPLAIWVLVLSIVSWAVCPVVPAIVALALAPRAQSNIDSSGGRLEGAGMVRAGRIISWVHLALVGVGIVIAIIAVVAIGAGSNSSTY